MNLADRIIKLRNARNMSQGELASGLSLSLKRLQNIENSGDASIQELVEVSRFFNADFNWLIMGAAPAGTKLNYIVLIDSKVVAGYLENKDDPTYLSQLEYYRIPGFPDNGEYRLFRVHGESMHPTLSENDHLVCSRVDNPKSLAEGEIVVLVTDSDIVVKRMRKDGDQYILESDNPKFKPFTLNEKDTRELWKVEAKVTKFIEKMLQQDGLDINSVAEEVRAMREQIARFKEDLEGIKREINGHRNP